MKYRSALRWLILLITRQRFGHSGGRLAGADNQVEFVMRRKVRTPVKLPLIPKVTYHVHSDPSPFTFQYQSGEGCLR
jgi:hypothetical protein